VSDDNLKLLNLLLVIAGLCLACFAIGLAVGTLL
jgi:hypothetical protein